MERLLENVSLFCISELLPASYYKPEGEVQRQRTINYRIPQRRRDRVLTYDTSVYLAYASSYVRFKTSYFKVSLMQDSLLLSTKDSLTDIAPVSLDSH